MSTVFALYDLGNLIQPWSVFSLGGPSPGILASIREEYISACDIVASKSIGCRFYWGLFWHVQTRENTLTVCLPEVQTLQERPHWVKRAWCLETSKLSAYLPHPLPHIVLVIDVNTLKLAAWSTVIELWSVIIIDFSVEVNQFHERLLPTQTLWSPFFYLITQESSFAILYKTSHYVCIEGNEIICAHILWTSSFKYIIYDISHFIESLCCLLSKPVAQDLDISWTPLTTF